MRETTSVPSSKRKYLRSFNSFSLSLTAFAGMLVGVLILLKGVTCDWSDPTMPRCELSLRLFGATYEYLLTLVTLMAS
jgi:hypothetical protein